MGFTYVYIPQDPSQPMEERVYADDVELENDKFIERLKEHFATCSKQEADVAVLRKQIEAKTSKEQMAKVTDEMMLMMGQMTTVEIFPVLLPVQTTGFEGVSVYVDDKGVSKNLSVNERASRLVQTAGYPADTRFFGDAFVAKVFDDQDAWRRMDMTMGEMNSDADWVKKTLHQRRNKPAGGNAMADLQKMMGGNTNAQVMGAGGNDDYIRHAQQQALPAITEENNSGSTDAYVWREENKEEVEITFKAEVTDKKKVKVDFRAKKLCVRYDGKELLNGSLKNGVETDECTWSIVNKKELVVTLMKQDAALWGGLLE